MKSLKLFNLLCLIVLLVACAPVEPVAPTATPEPTMTLKPTATPEPTAAPQYKILFVGNSLTFWNSGLQYYIARLADSADLPLIVKAYSVVEPGATLETMWKQTGARGMIEKNNYDVVILQDALPNTNVEMFHTYAREFIEEIRDAGAEPVLFMTWARKELTTEEIAQAYLDIATELDVAVAPVGLAWQRAMEERPELDMYDTDKIHPSIHGSYLTVNVMYATIFGESPVGLSYLPLGNPGVTEEEAAFLQRIAWEMAQESPAQD